MAVQIDQAGQDHPTGRVDPHALGLLGLDGLDLAAGPDHDVAVLYRPRGVSTQPCSAIASAAAARTATSRAAAADATWGGGISARTPAR